MTPSLPLKGRVKGQLITFERWTLDKNDRGRDKTALFYFVPRLGVMQNPRKSVLNLFLESRMSIKNSHASLVCIFETSHSPALTKIGYIC